MPFCCCQQLWLQQVGVVDGHQLVLMLVAPLSAAVLASNSMSAAVKHSQSNVSGTVLACIDTADTGMKVQGTKRGPLSGNRRAVKGICHSITCSIPYLALVLSMLRPALAVKHQFA
jgi:hypothetical protein